MRSNVEIGLGAVQNSERLLHQGECLHPVLFKAIGRIFPHCHCPQWRRQASPVATDTCFLCQCHSGRIRLPASRRPRFIRDASDTPPDIPVHTLSNSRRVRAPRVRFDEDRVHDIDWHYGIREWAHAPKYFGPRSCSERDSSPQRIRRKPRKAHTVIPLRAQQISCGLAD